MHVVEFHSLVNVGFRFLITNIESSHSRKHLSTMAKSTWQYYGPIMLPTLNVYIKGNSFQKLADY